MAHCTQARHFTSIHVYNAVYFYNKMLIHGQIEIFQKKSMLMFLSYMLVFLCSTVFAENTWMYPAKTDPSIYDLPTLQFLNQRCDQLERPADVIQDNPSP